ncbi:unnamed protein product, partial [Brachionus calyciflorus]
MSLNGRNEKCLKCQKVRFRDIPKSQYFALKSDESVRIANRFRPEIELQFNDFICNNCYRKGKRTPEIANNQLNENPLSTFDLNIENINVPFTESEIQIPLVEDNPTIEVMENNIPFNNILKEDKMVQTESQILSDYVYVDLPKSYSSHKRCIVCFRQNSYQKLHVIPLEARVQVMIKKSLFIPKDCRTCVSHLNGKQFIKEEIDLIVPFQRDVKMDKKLIKDLIDSLVLAAKPKGLFDEFADLDTLDEETCKETTGFSKNEFV